MPHNQLWQNHASSHQWTQNNQLTQPNWKATKLEDAKPDATKPEAPKTNYVEPEAAEDLSWLAEQKGGWWVGGKVESLLHHNELTRTIGGIKNDRSMVVSIINPFDNSDYLYKMLRDAYSYTTLTHDITESSLKK